MKQIDSLNQLRAVSAIIVVRKNIIRKWCLTALKQAIFMNGKVKSMRQKRMVVSFSPVKYLDYVLSL